MIQAESDEELLTRVRAGDEVAFLGLYRKLQGPIYRFALNMTGSQAAAEDVTQDVFLALIREEFGYLPDRGTLSGYLFGIARKLVLRYLERNRPVAEFELDNVNRTAVEAPIITDPVTDLMHREGIEALRRAVISLPKRYREVVVLCDLEEVDYADAAGVLGCPVGTVRSRLHRARGLLLEKLQKHDNKPGVKTLNPARSLI
jgi:RNA polymerase sigma-70 factor (ECF subfamily)